jgi:cation:H+ antiporter
MDALTLFLFVLGLGLLIGGAEMLVRGSARLAAAFGIPPLIIGLTVVAFGTSSPELAVSLQSALNGQADIAVGNVLGSNVFNILFILGISALITPLVVSTQLIRIDVPIMVLVSVALFPIAADGTISRFDGVLLLLGLAAYGILLIRLARSKPDETEDYTQEYGIPARGAKAILINLALVVGGLVLLVLGSRWLVDGAVMMARAFGISELVIGLTIVAAGTSLPEVATSILAAIKGERDIAVGNVVGSNIFNILCVLGMSAIVAPAGVPVSDTARHFDLWVVLAVAAACLPVFFTAGSIIRRWEGLVFLAYYLCYTLYLLFNSTGHAMLPAFSQAMKTVVLPLTALILLIDCFREWRARNANPRK